MATASRPDTRTLAPPAVSRWRHAVIAVVIIASLATQPALLSTGGADADSGQAGAALDLGTRLWRLFGYFTTQSNLVVLAVALTLARDPARDGPPWRVARLDALLGILITGLVFAVVLAPQVHFADLALVATIGLPAAPRG